MPYMTETPAISGRTRLRSASAHHSSWSSLTFSGCSAATSCACVKSLRQVVELPARRRGPGPSRTRDRTAASVCGERSQGRRSGREARPPAVLVHAAAAEHLEVLLGVPLGRRRVVEGVQEAGAVHGLLRDAVDRLRLRDAGRLQDRRADVDDVRELRARGAASGWMRLGQAMTIGSRVPPRWLADCLPHWKGAFMACAQAAATCGAVWSPPMASRPPYCSMSCSCCVGVEHDAVEERHLVERAGRRALQAGAVVTPDVDDQGVVQVAQGLDLVEEPARRSSRRSPGSPRRPPSGGRRASSACRSASPRPGRRRPGAA